MNAEDFEKKMENLDKPQLGALTPPKELKLAILGAQRSAVIGIWFVVVPAFFLMCVFMKYAYRVNLGIIDTFENMMSELDGSPGNLWITPILLVGLPIVAMVLNVLSITHFRWEPSSKSLILSIKMKWLNLAVLLASTVIVGIFFLYLVSENFR